MSTKIHPFYINILLLNKEDVVASAVGSKTGIKGGILGRVAAFAANKLVTDEKIINNLSTTLIDKCKSTVTEMGISADFKKVFQKGAFVVIKVQLVEVDKLALVLAAKGPEFASSFTNLIASITSLGLADTVIPTIDEKISNMTNAGMMNKFAEVIPQKMAESGLHVDCVVHSSTEEADIFFDLLETVG